MILTWFTLVIGTVHFESHFTSSRFWIWLRMQICKLWKVYMGWLMRKEMIEQFFEDIDTENPKYILIDSTYYGNTFLF